MQADAIDIQNRSETKLLSLYQSHNIAALELIDLLEMERAVINDGSGYKIEHYSQIEKNLVSKVIVISKAIKEYESLVFKFSDQLESLRTRGTGLREVIKELQIENMNLLRFSIDKTSKILDSFTMKTIYNLPVINEPSPQFVDFSV